MRFDMPEKRFFSYGCIFLKTKNDGFFHLFDEKLNLVSDNDYIEAGRMFDHGATWARKHDGRCVVVDTTSTEHVPQAHCVAIRKFTAGVAPFSSKEVIPTGVEDGYEEMGNWGHIDGTALIRLMCCKTGTDLCVLQEAFPKTFEEELTKDIVTLMTVFCARLYGKRSHKNKTQSLWAMIGVPSQQYRKKPTMQQTELADPHFVDAKRIKELGNAAELSAYRTMVRCLDEVSVEKNREQLEALLRAFGKERQHFIDLLFTRDHRAFCIGNRWRKLRDALVMEKYRSSYGLQARHWKMALQTAAATVSNYWRLVQANALSRIRRKAWFVRLNKLEQRYVHFLLGSLSEDFFTMLDGKCPSVVTNTEKESVASRKGLCKAMVRTIHDEQGKRPKHGRDASVWFDCSCYKAVVVGEQVRLDLMSLTPGVRLTLYVKGSVPVSSTLKLVKHPDGAMALHVQKSMSKSDIRPIDSPKASRGKLYCRALDLGFTEVATDDAGNRFGTCLGEKLTGYARYLDAKLKERNKLMARAQKAGKAKRRRMLRCNLGSKKFTKELQRIRTEIQNTVNKGLNDILKQSPAQVYALKICRIALRLRANTAERCATC